MTYIIFPNKWGSDFDVFVYFSGMFDTMLSKIPTNVFYLYTILTTNFF